MMVGPYNWAANCDERLTVRKLTACITLDLETDYATGKFCSERGVEELALYCQVMELPLTVFVEGRMLRDHAHVLGRFPSNTSFQLHCNDHGAIPDTPESLAAGIQSFVSVFRQRPSGYRAGNYRVNAELMEELIANRFTWDASLRRGPSAMRSTVGLGADCFQLQNGLLELPVAALPTIGMPLTMSTLSLIGILPMTTLMRLFGVPRLLVFVMHLHDLFASPALGEATLSRRIGHTWNYRMGRVDPFERFKAFIGLLKKEEYTFRTCNDVVGELRASSA